MENLYMIFIYYYFMYVYFRYSYNIDTFIPLWDFYISLAQINNVLIAR